MNTYNMTHDEYKKYICEICNRIIKNKLINIIREGDTKSVTFKIQIVPIEWYIELDDDLKYNVEYNLHNLFKPLINEAINQYNKEKQEKEEKEEKQEKEEKEEKQENSVDEVHINKRQKN